MDNNIECAVGVLVFNKNGELLLAKSYKEFDRWVIPGGHVRYGERLFSCAKREVKEEVGVAIRNIVFLNVKESLTERLNESGKIEKKHFIFINFVAKAVNELKIKVDNRELQDYVWIDPKKALKFEGVSRSVKALIKDYIIEGKNEKN